ncbi:MAG: ATP-binding protein [Anaerolineae bacterium]
MNLRIESINVRGLGPIASLQWALRDINLIYGHNEQGKTFLVEYLLSSLFKTRIPTRPLTDSGSVVVAGLEGGSREFSPKSKKKLDTLLFEENGIMNVDLVRLLVVKGGESSFQPDKPEALTKSVLKGYLSDQRTYDEVEKEIQATTLTSTFENGEIRGSAKRGEPVQEQALKQRLDGIDELLSEVEQKYSLAEIAGKRAQLAAVEGQIADQELARRAYAADTARRMAELQLGTDKLPADEITTAHSLLKVIEERRADIAGELARIAELEPQAAYYEWLKAALEACQDRPNAFKRDYTLLLGILSAVLTAVTAAAAFTRQPLFSLVTGLLALAALGLAYWQYRVRQANAADVAEVQGLYAEYETRFGERPQALTTLANKLEQVARAHTALELRRSSLAETRDKLRGSELELQALLSALPGTHDPAADPYAVLADLQDRRRGLEAQLKDLDHKLAAAQVPPEEYYEGHSAVPYDGAELERLKQQQAGLEQGIAGAAAALENLKDAVRRTTGDPATTGWEDLIANLRARREETAAERRQLRARIIGGITLGQVISGLRAREDERIAAALDSDTIREPIRAVTRGYTRVELEGEELIVHGPARQYALGSLSTGAQEQLLLALRIGIAGHVLGETRMFLVLDDAFQHSDWERRPVLVDALADLAGLGWQVLYFTMDDHIRGLFEERVGPRMGERFGMWELG